MRGRERWTTVWVLLAGLSVFSASTLAAGKDAARVHYKDGVKLFESDKYSEAAEAFRKAYEIKPVWKILFNIGQSEAAAKRYGVALDAFEDYLAQGGDDVSVDRRDFVSDEIRRLRPLVGVLEVVGPDGVDIYIDGKKRAVTPLSGPLRVAVGKRDISLRIGSETIREKKMRIAGSMVTRLEAEKTSDNTSDTTREPVEEPDEFSDKPRGWMWTAGWVGTGLGAGLLGASLVTGLMALSLGNDLQMDADENGGLLPKSRSKDKDKMKNLGTATTALVVSGGVVAAVGITLLILETTMEESRSDISVVPMFGHGLAGAAINESF